MATKSGRWEFHCLPLRYCGLKVSETLWNSEPSAVSLCPSVARPWSSAVLRNQPISVLCTRSDQPLTLFCFQIDRHEFVDRQRAAWSLSKLEQALSQRRLVNFNDAHNVVGLAAEVVHACGQQQRRPAQTRRPPARVDRVLLHALHESLRRHRHFVRFVAELQPVGEPHNVNAWICEWNNGQSLIIGNAFFKRNDYFLILYVFLVNLPNLIHKFLQISQTLFDFQNMNKNFGRSLTIGDVFPVKFSKMYLINL